MDRPDPRRSRLFSVWRLTFKVPIDALSRLALAQESLQQQFTRHKCETEEQVG